jgi:hypothetical protein
VNADVDVPFSDAVKDLSFGLMAALQASAPISPGMRRPFAGTRRHCSACRPRSLSAIGPCRSTTTTGFKWDVIQHGPILGSVIRF